MVNEFIEKEILERARMATRDKIMEFKNDCHNALAVLLGGAQNYYNFSEDQKLTIFKHFLEGDNPDKWPSFLTEAEVQKIVEKLIRGVE